MTSHAPVPADVEPDSIIDLVDDCREVSGVLGLPPLPVPGPRGALPVEIDARTAASLAGWGAYGV